MNPEVTLSLAAELRSLKFFPADAEALNAIVRLLGNMCETEDQVEWLIHRMTSGIYSEWPGIAEIRACYCSRFRPKDGINAYSSVYPDRFPLSPEGEQREKLEAAKAAKSLPPGHAVSAAPSVENAVQDLAKLKDLNRVGPAGKVREIPSLPPGVKPVTQADIDQAVKQHRAARERKDAEEIRL